MNCSAPSSFSRFLRPCLGLALGLLGLVAPDRLPAQSFSCDDDAGPAAPDAMRRETRAVRLGQPAPRAGQAEAGEASPFAGFYTVTYQSQRPCTNNYAYVAVEFDDQGQMIDCYGAGGRAGFGRPTSFSGAVDAGGNASWTLNFVSGSASVVETWQGRLAGASGGGTASSTNSCRATWSATRGTAALPSAFYESLRLNSDPVDTATGAYVARLTWLRQNAPADLALVMEYNSGQLADGRLGLGWSHNFEMRVDDVGGDRLVFNWSQQRRNTFRRVGTGGTYACADRAMRYDVLTKNANGTFTLRLRDQGRYEFNSAGRLTQVVNPRGQAINLTYSADGTVPVTITEAISGRALAFAYDSGGRLARVTDPLGRRVTFTYDSIDRLLAVALANASGQVAAGFAYTYDGVGRILTATDAEGVKFLTNTYDNRGRCTTQQDARPGSQATRFDYDDLSVSGRLLVRVTDRNGQASLYTYNDRFQLLSLRNGNGEATAYGYDADGNALTTTDALGRVTRRTYDAQGNLLTTTDPVGSATAMTYDARNNLTKVRDAAGKETAFAFDANNNVTSAVNPLGQTVAMTYGAGSLLTRRTAPRGGNIDYTYTAGLPTSVRDANGLTTTLAYDAAGRLTALTDPAGKARTLAYGTNDDLLTITDPRGKVTTLTYDSRHRKLSEANPLGQATRWTYDGNGNVLSRTDPLGNVTRFAYDGEDRLAAVTDPRGNVSFLGYDSAGRLVAATDAAGQTRVVRYNAAGDRVGESDARGNARRTVVDARGLAVGTEDALNRASFTEYDARGRAVRGVNPLGQAAALAYDDVERLVQVTDPLGRVTRQAFDADGNRTGLTNARGAVTTFDFDLGGRLTKLTTAGGRATTYGYDARGLLVSSVDPAGRATTLAYDEAGRLSRLADAGGTIDYAYDDAGRLLTVTSGGASIRREYDAAGRLTRFTDAAGNVLQYAYDAAGNLVRLAYPDGKQVAYAYDAANRLIRVADWAGRTTTYAYDPDGRLVLTTRPNGTQETRAYDEAGQLVQIRDFQGASLIAQFDLLYDPAGRILAERPQPASTAPSPVAFTATYDADNRLATFNGVAVAFDANGNLTSGPAVTGAGSAAFSYDARNRLTALGGTTYGYDAENRRVSLADASGTTRYVHNPNAPLSQLLMRTAPNGTVTRAVYGLGLICEEAGSAVRYFHYDFRGSAVAFTDAAGAVIGRVQYAPYGEIAGRSGNTDTPFLYGGQDGALTDASGLVDLRARFYHPGVRRFLNQDILLGDASDPPSLNRYGFAGGDPVGSIDPTGHFIVQLIGTATGAAFGLLGQIGSDLIAGELSSRNKYYGAIAGGAVTGLIVSIAPGAAVSAGAIGGAFGEYVTQQTEINRGTRKSLDFYGIGGNGLLGGILGRLGGLERFRAQGYNAGYNSGVAQIRMANTRFLNSARKGDLYIPGRSRLATITAQFARDGIIGTAFFLPTDVLHRTIPDLYLGGGVAGEER